MMIGHSSLTLNHQSAKPSLPGRLLDPPRSKTLFKYHLSMKPLPRPRGHWSQTVVD